MGTLIYVLGSGSITGKITEKDVKDICDIKNIWEEPAFQISNKGGLFEFIEASFEGSYPYQDGVVDPLNKLLDIARIRNLSVNAGFTIKSDCSDYDNIEMMITDNNLKIENSEIVHASTEELEQELRNRKEAQRKNSSFFDIVLLEKPGSEGLTRTEVMDLYDILSDTKAFPVEIGDVNGNSSAMGFITPEAAEKLQYEYGQDSELGRYISAILDDKNLETENGIYLFNGLDIWLNYESDDED